MASQPRQGAKLPSPAQRDAKRQRDAASKRRVRARARGEEPAEPVRPAARRVYLPVAVSTPDLRGATCVGYDPDVWFPEGNSAAAIAKAVAICRSCPVRTGCHSKAEANREAFGIWAGTDRENRAIAAKPDAA